MESDYFGKIEEDWAGFSSEYSFSIPYFNREVEVFLGSEYDDEGNETESLQIQQLSDYERTLKSFLENIDDIIILIKEKAFEHYKKFYAHYYEKEFTVEGFFETDKNEGDIHSPLIIDTQDAHFEYMKNIESMRVLDNNTIILPIYYKLDREHGLEILLRENKVVNVSGIGEN